MTGSGPLLVPGVTCQTRALAQRLTVLVDGQAYFRALAGSLALAERQALIVGWDIDPDTVLWRGDDPGPTPPGGLPWRTGRALPARFGPLLDDLARRRLRLHCHVLAWDFGTLFAVKRRFVPVYHLDWASHRRVRVRLDSAHPFGAAVHLKTACIDDAVAYVGGLDISRGRWDRPGHLSHDPLRVDPNGTPTPPWHDQQLLVSGHAAGAIGDFLRDRWRLATGQRLPIPPAGLDAWPAGVQPDLHDVHVGLARTEPAWDDRPAVREVERLYLEVIARAKRLIYLENQYITAHVIAAALARRLAEPDGPEVVIVSSLRSSGFLEQATMDVRRARFIARLERADLHGRLRILYPQTAPEQHIKVHSKVALIDDWYLSVGSSNLANRSMGTDVELDLAVEAHGKAEAAVRALVPRHRHRLIGEWFDLPLAEVRAALAQHDGSLVRTLDTLRAQAGERTLVPLRASEGTALVPAIFSDPEHALDLATWADKSMPDGLPRSMIAVALRAGVGLLLFAALESVWHGFPTEVAADPGAMAEWLEPTGPGPVALLTTLVALILSGVLPLPMGALLALVGFAFGPAAGLPLCVVGAEIGALLGWITGRLLGPNRVRGVAVPRLNALTRRLARGGMVSIAELRILPRYTWAEVNLVAGASQLDLRDFLAGTALGLIPGALVLVSAGAVVGHAVRQPGPLSVPAALVVSLMLATGMTWLWRRQDLFSRT